MAADPIACTIDVKKPAKLDGLHPPSVFAYSRFPTDEQSKSLLRIGDWIVANGIDSPGDYRAARDLLLRPIRRAFAPGQSLAPEARAKPRFQAACSRAPGSRWIDPCFPSKGLLVPEKLSRALG